MNKMLNKIISIVVAIVVSVSLCGSIGGQTAHAAIFSPDNCLDELPTLLEWRTLEFASFLDIHFQSEENNTSLVDLAIDAFRGYKKAVLKELEKFQIEAGANMSADQFNAYNLCLAITDEYISNARYMLVSHVRTTTRVKQTTILLDKFKSINSKLSDMNFLVGQIVAAFKTFENKLPGFLRDCLK